MRLIKFCAIFLCLLPLATKGENSCNLSLMKFIHHPKRLKMLEGCVTIRGVVVGIPLSNPWDGDRHVDIKPDPEFERLLSEVNRRKGYLVVEFVCQSRLILEPEARRVCAGYTKRFELPKVGDYVEITGIHVEDLEHGHNELHPGSDMVVLRKRTTRK